MSATWSRWRHKRATAPRGDDDPPRAFHSQEPSFFYAFFFAASTTSSLTSFFQLDPFTINHPPSTESSTCCARDVLRPKRAWAYTQVFSLSVIASRLPSRSPSSLGRSGSRGAFHSTPLNSAASAAPRRLRRHSRIYIVIVSLRSLTTFFVLYILFRHLTLPRHIHSSVLFLLRV